MISAEFIVSTGPYQHVKLTVSGDDVVCFSRELESIDDKLKARLGEFEAELISWTGGVFQSIDNGNMEHAKQMIENALGPTTVVEVIEHEPKPPADTPAWEEKPATTKPAPWKANNW